MIIRTLAVALLVLHTLVLAAQDRAVHARAGIALNGKADISRLQSLGICLDHTQLDRGVIRGDLSVRDLDLAREAGFDVRIEIGDVGAYYAARAAEQAGLERSFGDPGCPGSDPHPFPSQFTLGSMGGFPTWQEMQDQLDAMVAQYPALISPKVTIGTSHEGRPIHYLRISNDPTVDQAKPEVLYDALHHARSLKAPCNCSTSCGPCWSTTAPTR